MTDQILQLSKRSLLFLPTIIRQGNNSILGLNQLPDSLTRWQHGSQICFESFILQNHKIAHNSATTKVREKINTYLESLEF